MAQGFGLQPEEPLLELGEPLLLEEPLLPEESPTPEEPLLDVDEPLLDDPLLPEESPTPEEPLLEVDEPLLLDELLPPDELLLELEDPPRDDVEEPPLDDWLSALSRSEHRSLRPVQTLLKASVPAPPLVENCRSWS